MELWIALGFAECFYMILSQVISGVRYYYTLSEAQRVARSLSDDTSPETAGAEIALLALAALVGAEARPLIKHILVQPDLAPRPREAVVQMLAAMPRVRRCIVQAQGDTLLLTVRRETDSTELDLARLGTDSIRTLVREFGGEDEARPVLIDAAGELLRASWEGLEAWLTGYSGDGAFSYAADSPDEAMAAAGVRAVIWVGFAPAQYSTYESGGNPPLGN
jgi:hypothetical protein